MLHTRKILLLLLAATCVYSQQYGIRMRWTSNDQGCTNPPDEIQYWPIGSPFAEQGSGTCEETLLAHGARAYFTYSTSDSIPSIPESWSPFYAGKTYYENNTACNAAEQDTVASVVLTNSDSCIFMGVSTMGYNYLRLDCSSAEEGLVHSCRDSGCTDCRPTYKYQGGCDSFINSVHYCAGNPAFPPAAAKDTTPTGYGVRMRWVSNEQGCTNEPDSIDYWPLGSPFALEGEGSCVETEVGGGGVAYYTYTTSETIPAQPASWSPFYAENTYYFTGEECSAADPAEVDLVTMTNSDSCIFMGASTMGYHYLRLACSSEDDGLVYSCRDSACSDCRPAYNYEGGCESFVNSVHSCEANPNSAVTPSPAPTPLYGIRYRWTSNAQACTDAPDAIEYWPIGSPFAPEGEGSCVEKRLGGGGYAYYTYSSSVSLPSLPPSWSPFHAVHTYFENRTVCSDADPSTVLLTSLTNSDSCIFMGSSTMGYNYMRLACSSEDEGLVYSCRDSACSDCRPTYNFQGGCDDFVNSVHFCASA